MYSPISFKSDYSLLKSLLKVKEIINYAKDNKASYVGILDDNLYGIMDFYDKCEQNNLKCIFGMIVKIGEYKLYLYIKDYSGYTSRSEEAAHRCLLPRSCICPETSARSCRISYYRKPHKMCLFS